MLPPLPSRLIPRSGWKRRGAPRWVLGLVLSLCFLHADTAVGPNKTVQSGEVYDVIDSTRVHTQGTVTVEPGGDSVFWSKKVELKSGFRAKEGSYFQAVADQDLNGVPDSEQSSLVDADQDRIQDTWEIAHFGSIGACNPEGDPDGDGLTNYSEYLLGGQPQLGARATSANDLRLTVFTPNQ